MSRPWCNICGTGCSCEHCRGEQERCSKCNVLLSQAHPMHTATCDGRQMGPGWEFGLDPLARMAALVRFARSLGVDPATLSGSSRGSDV